MFMVINHIGLSSGKDSTALWGWAINDSGYPIGSIRGTFADTQNEYDEVYDQIKALDEYGQKRGVAPIKTLHSEGFLNLAIRKKRFPGARSRFCTEVLKIVPYLHWVQEQWLNGDEVVGHVGVRASESTERSLLDEWGQDPISGLKVRRPLLKWTLGDIWKAHHRYGLPINPLYKQGWTRVGCRLCVMSNKKDVRRTAKKRPWVIDVYEQWEKIVGSYKKDGVPSSFFPATNVPEQQRSLKGLIRKRDNAKGKKGDIYSANTIRDVVRWSMTLRGGTQGGFDFMFEEDDSHAPCKMGYCE